MSKLKIQLSQINTTVGDLAGNTKKILQEFSKANQEGCDLVVFPEMTICGYPCEDLWLKKSFLEEIKKFLEEIVLATKDKSCAILLGAPSIEINRAKKEVIQNSAFLISDAKVEKIINKTTLPNFGVFDEKRYFEGGNHLSIFRFREFDLAILICEDLWNLKNLYLLQEQEIDAIITLNSSPYTSEKHLKRKEICENFVKNLNKPLIYVNQVGGQDSLVFDGSSFVLNSEKKEVLRLAEFAEDCAIFEITKSSNRVISCSDVAKSHQSSNPKIIGSSKIERDYLSATLALHDYVKKNGFTKVLLGMSGGIDSALVAAIAVDALGFKNVELYALPSRFNSKTSMIDATKCAENLGITLKIISIEETFKAMLATLGEVSDLTKENLQSRIRGNILMALSNNSGALLLSTGNKSELACGYATLYGDMCGAFNPIKDFYKTQVYELANWRNSQKQIIPINILTKAPTAELRENQKDSDSLPEYDVLDKILFSLIEENKSVVEIAKSGFEEELVKKVAKLFYSSEYKRRQSCLGPKISEMAFDKDRRYPITNKFIK